MSTAKAANGHIEFFGAVVEPTCPVADVQAELANTLQPGNHHRSGHRNCGRTATSAGRGYSQAVVRLGSATEAGNRLLQYFVGYVHAGGDGAQAVLVERSYE